jgi:hypothetical protein
MVGAQARPDSEKNKQKKYDPRVDFVFCRSTCQ